jgi:anaerobic selenocysteine-containing dehydrogenase
MEKDIPYKVEGDFENPLNKGKLCIKGLSTLEYVYHPDRLRHPLMRSGERGGGNWKQVSWDEALDHVAEVFNKIKKNHGAESVAFIRGASKSYLDIFLARLANVFGSPNLATMGQCCHVPRSMASTLTCGYYALPDIEHPPSCIVVWGYNPEETFFYEYETILEAIEHGSKLIVIDPRKTNLAEKANFWIQLRPGTDLALALGMINIMINEDCYDQDFVDKWTIGFGELKTHIQKYTPEKVEEITWVPRKLLKEMTINYAKSKPACILLGNAIDHNLNSFQTARAVTILRTISGNLGVPGGEIEWKALPLLGREPAVMLANKIPIEIMEQRVSAKCKILPLFKSVTPDTVIKAVLEEDPYPIRAAFIQGANPLLTYPNVQNVYDAFRKLDFLVVADMFMTPTAVLADIVLPVASFLEVDSIFVPPQNIPIALAQRKVVEIGECWSDFKIIIELAKRLGLGEDFIWENEEQAWNEILKPSGFTFEKFKQIGEILSSKLYGQYESKGFNTPSGKVEIYSARLKKWGYDPIPVYDEPPETPYSEPESFQKYPFILTSWKPSPYRHSWGHQINKLRTSNPEPIVLINPETGKKLGVQDGDWVYIETKRGLIKQKAKLESGIDARLIVAEFGWWYPEREVSDLNRWKESNINLLTDDETLYARIMGSANEMGSPTLRGIFCNVYKGG